MRQNQLKLFLQISSFLTRRTGLGLSLSKLKSLKSSPIEFIKASSSSCGSKSGMKLSKSDDCPGPGPGKESGVNCEGGGAGLEGAGGEGAL